MARRKVTCALQLENWQQADDALRQIGENRRDLAAIENISNVAAKLVKKRSR